MGGWVVVKEELVGGVNLSEKPKKNWIERSACLPEQVKGPKKPKKSIS